MKKSEMLAMIPPQIESTVTWMIKNEKAKKRKK